MSSNVSVNANESQDEKLRSSGFIFKESLEGNPASWLRAVGFEEKLGGENPEAIEVTSYDNIEELRIVAQYFKELLDNKQISAGDILEVMKQMKSYSLDELVAKELFGYDTMAPRGKILMSAAKQTMINFFDKHEKEKQKFLTAYGADNIEHLFTPEQFGRSPEKLISMIASFFKGSKDLSNEFKDLLIENAFEDEFMVNFLANSSNDRYFIYKQPGEKELVVKFEPTDGPNERNNIVYVRFQDKETGKILQATIRPKAIGKGFMGMPTDNLPTGYIPDVTYQIEVINTDGSREFVNLDDADTQKLKAKNPIGFLKSGE